MNHRIGGRVCIPFLNGNTATLTERAFEHNILCSPDTIRYSSQFEGQPDICEHTCEAKSFMFEECQGGEADTCQRNPSCIWNPPEEKHVDDDGFDAILKTNLKNIVCPKAASFVSYAVQRKDFDALQSTRVCDIFCNSDHEDGCDKIVQRALVHPPTSGKQQLKTAA